MLNNASILEYENNTTSPRRESRKRRRVSERRRVFSRLGVTSPNQPEQIGLSVAERHANMAGGESMRTLRSDSLAGAGAQFYTSDQGKIAMKIQFYIVIAPDNEPLILDHSEQHQLPAPIGTALAAGQKRQISSESTSMISEHINERLSRQNSSTRRRQQLLAMHKQSAQDNGSGNSIRRAGSISAGPTTPSIEGDGSPPPPIASRDGLRSSTITGGMPQDAATINFLSRQNQAGAARMRDHGSGSLTSTSTGSLGNLVGQHQTLMASSNNIRARLEGREHIYFKRDGQRFGHEFTLKLAVDKSYRCLLKVRPLVPVAAISIQGHHVSFVDCSLNGGGGASASQSLSSASLHGGSLTHLSQSQAKSQPRHQSIGNLLGSSSSSSSATPTSARAHRPGITPAGQHQNSDPNPVAAGAQRQNHQHDQNSASLSSLSLAHNNGGHYHHQQQHHHHHHHQQQQVGSSVKLQLHQQLVKQQQQHQMMRHFAGGAGASAGQLVYMFDWSASRFEVNKNKARTQVHTVLKFKNGEILSLPLQVKFYEPECRQHLSWGSQLHFIDYDCQINSMGQISVDRIQYY